MLSNALLALFVRELQRRLSDIVDLSGNMKFDIWLPLVTLVIVIDSNFKPKTSFKI